MKPCSKCGIIKSFSKFGKRKDAKDGLRHDCKVCVGERNKKKYQRLKTDDKYQEYLRNYRKENSEHIKAYLREYNNLKYTPEELEQKAEITRLVKVAKAAGKKFCHTCSSEKLPTDFYVRKYSADSRAEQCKRCQLASKKKRYDSVLSTSIEYKAKQKKFREDNKAYLLQYQKEYRDTHKEHRAELHKKWRKENPEATRRASALRRARKANAPGYYTLEDWLSLCEQYNHTCPACQSIKKLTVDHIKPLAKGGSNSIDNIQPLCLTCNISKGIKEIRFPVPQPTAA